MGDDKKKGGMDLWIVNWLNGKMKFSRYVTFSQARVHDNVCQPPFAGWVYNPFTMLKQGKTCNETLRCGKI